MLAQLRPAIVSLAVLTAVTGMVYPIVVTIVSKAVFPGRSQGSLIESNGKVVGSRLVGQSFSDPRRFWGRPSATSPYPYNAASSSGSNLGPMNPALVDAVKARVNALKGADPGNTKPVPVDLVTASGSGLDPHISVAAADYQVSRVARARGLDPAKVASLVAKHTEGRQWGFLGEPRVNVLELNLELESLK
ncbi:MAG TPA: potassium-transporting ATPase subunit KdpC [Usitatibacter sp.]|jgi:K+-transporting ATPase ATPase C chain|nr:potassium-transporting ATPase subunit KdpC [Usitatibacter sp.]